MLVMSTQKSFTFYTRIGMGPIRTFPQGVGMCEDWKLTSSNRNNIFFGGDNGKPSTTNDHAILSC